MSIYLIRLNLFDFICFRIYANPPELSAISDHIIGNIKISKMAFPSHMVFLLLILNFN